MKANLELEMMSASELKIGMKVLNVGKIYSISFDTEHEYVYVTYEAKRIENQFFKAYKPEDIIFIRP